MTTDRAGLGELEGNFFVSYRRDDSADVVGRILDRLDDFVGDREIFRDIDDIPLGVDFAAYIDEAIKSASVLLVAIGPNWISAESPDGARRLDEPDDFVRLEVAAALARDIPIIPLLVRGAQMPAANDLPDDIQPLAMRNGIPIRPDPDFDIDVERLVKRLEQFIPNRSDPRESDSPASPVVLPRPTPRPPARPRVGRWIGLGVLVVVAGVFAVSRLFDTTPPTVQSSELVVHSVEPIDLVNNPFVENPVAVDFSLITGDRSFTVTRSRIMLIDQDGRSHGPADDVNAVPDGLTGEIPAETTRRFTVIFDVGSGAEQLELVITSFGPNPETVTAHLP